MPLVEGNEGGPGGDAILVFAPDGTESAFATGLADPRGIAFDPSGDLFVAEIKAAAVRRYSEILKTWLAKRSSLLTSGNLRVMVVRSS